MIDETFLTTEEVLEYLQVNLPKLLEFLRPGDTLVVTRVDRLARSAVDLHNIVADLTKRGVHLGIVSCSISVCSQKNAGILLRREE